MQSSITTFREQSTWRLLGLGIITYGVYLAHYIKRQTRRINDEVGEELRLPEGLANFILVISYISLAFFVVYMTVDEQHPLAQMSNLVDLVSSISLVVWGFMARNRLNRHYAFEPGTRSWFHAFWTFLFTPLYFNYKVNCLCEALEEPSAQDRKEP